MKEELFAYLLVLLSPRVTMTEIMTKHAVTIRRQAFEIRDFVTTKARCFTAVRPWLRHSL